MWTLAIVVLLAVLSLVLMILSRRHDRQDERRPDFRRTRPLDLPRHSGLDRDS